MIGDEYIFRRKIFERFVYTADKCLFLPNFAGRLRCLSGALRPQIQNRIPQCRTIRRFALVHPGHPVPADFPDRGRLVRSVFLSSALAVDHRPDYNCTGTL